MANIQIKLSSKAKADVNLPADAELGQKVSIKLSVGGGAVSVSQKYFDKHVAGYISQGRITTEEKEGFAVSGKTSVDDSKLQVRINELENELDNAKTENGELQSKIGELSDDFTAESNKFKAEIEGLKAKLLSTEDELKMAQEITTETESKLKSANETIAKLNEKQPAPVKS